MEEEDLVCQLLSFKNKAIQGRLNAKDGTEARVNITDVKFFVDNGMLVIDSGNVRSAKTEDNKSHERYFAAGSRKHVEILGQVSKAFETIGL